jgi:hypothetical protein
MLVQRYKSDLKRVDGEIEQQRRTVDLFELESAKEELLKSFHEKMMEIDLKINQIQPTVSFSSRLASETKSSGAGESQPELLLSQKQSDTGGATPAKQQQTGENKEKSSSSSRERPKNKAEERLDAIREEVLKAMERLEQIETES